MATTRQIAANRKNAQKSTGPVTDAGKTVARANALKHGLAGDGVVLETDDAAAVEQRLCDWRDSFRPGDAEEHWLFHQVVVESVRIDRCQSDEWTLRRLEANRAAVCWDDDRTLDAEETAAGLARRPPLVARRLRRNTQGCHWLRARWAALAAALNDGGEWSESQKSLAFDLLGTPPDLRGANPWGVGSSPAELADGELKELERLQVGGLDRFDNFERQCAAEGLSVEPSRAIARLKRYEASCFRRFQWARQQLLERRNARPVAEPAPPPPPPPPPTGWRPRAGSPPVQPDFIPPRLPNPPQPPPAPAAVATGSPDEPDQDGTEAPAPPASAPVSSSTVVLGAALRPATPHRNRRARRAALKDASRRR